MTEPTPETPPDALFAVDLDDPEQNPSADVPIPPPPAEEES